MNSKKNWARGEGERKIFLFHKRLLMALVIYVFIDLKFNGEKINISGKVNKNCNFCSHLIKN